MFDHVGIPVADAEAAVGFFNQVLAPLGIAESMRTGDENTTVVGFAAPDGAPRFWVASAAPDATGDELHIAFTAPDRATVDAVYDAAVAAGAEILHAPREWPEYHPGYYGVFVRDLDGNNIEAVCHS